VKERLDVVIVGAGFAGMYMRHEVVAKGYEGFETS
jgi:cation diffusion facilitator CzcD-associated flavoprotein CzcO